MEYIGKKVAKIDGIAVATGKPVYTSDLDLNINHLVVKLLRSPHAHAKIIHIDTTKALALPGVECVLTYKDVPDIPFTLAGQSYPEPSPYDRKILDQWVRYVGDEVAIIAAIDELTALQALRLIDVKYEVLPAVLDLNDAIDNPVRVHQQDPYTNFPIGAEPARNIAAGQYLEFGDVEKELAASEIVLERTYKTQAQAHAMMETYRASTYLDVNGRLHVTSSTQIPYHVRRHLARVLAIPKSKIKIIKPRVGGGFGGKQTASVEIFPALITHLTKKPAKLVYTRQETFTSTTSRHAMQLTVRIGAQKDGTINAVDIYCLSDTGAYGEHAPTVFWVVGQKTLPMYGSAKACRYHGHAVYTNKTPAGALRGYGATQGTFAQESIINELAAELKLDPAEIRLKNLTQQGQLHPALCGSTPECSIALASTTLHDCIRKGKEAIGWQNYPSQTISPTRRRGYGMAVTMQGSGIAGIDTGSVIIKLNEDAFFTLSHAASDMGQGSDTIMGQIAADILDVDFDQIIISSQDLDTLPYDPGAYASSGAYVTGCATAIAAEEMKEKMITAAARLLETDRDSVQYKDGVFISAEKELPLAELAQTLCSFSGQDQLVSIGTFGSPTSPPPFVAGFAEVEVDLETGQCELLKYVAVTDCGTVLNENLARIQVEGGIVMGIGMGLFEDVRYSGKGRLSTSSLMEYKIPSRQDLGEIEVHFMPSFEPSHKLGVKSIGEVVINTPPPAIADAVFNATGVRCRSLPITAEKILLKLAHD